MKEVKAVRCSKCRKLYDPTTLDLSRPNAILMVSNNICFDCAYWMNYIINPLPGTHIINGTLWAVVPIWDSLTLRKALKRADRFLHNHIKNKVGICATPYKIKDVPKLFQTTLSDEYKFISEDTYKKLLKHRKSKCCDKGCWDRYKCYWYDMDNEKNGPFNKLPDYYKPGIEKCVSFINKETMYDVE